MKPIKMVSIALILAVLFAFALTVKFWPNIEIPEHAQIGEIITDYVVEPSGELPEEQVPEPEPILVQPAEAKPVKETAIKVTEDALSPAEVVVQKGSAVKWVVGDEKFHRISCYGENNIRMAFSDILKNKGESYRLTFNQNGEYLCMDAVFGLRGKIIVKEHVLSITGAAVALKNRFSPKDHLTPLIFVLVLIAGIIIANKVVKKRPADS